MWSKTTTQSPLPFSFFLLPSFLRYDLPIFSKNASHDLVDTNNHSQEDFSKNKYCVNQDITISKRP